MAVGQVQRRNITALASLGGSVPCELGERLKRELPLLRFL